MEAIAELEAKEQETAQALIGLGFVENDPCVFELDLGLRWLIEYDYRNYTLSEWREKPRHWQKVAEYFSGDFLVASLEAARICK